MISGVTLLDKKESIIKIWKDRIFRTFIVLFSFSLFYFLCDVKIGKETLDFVRFIKVFINEGWVIPFWYLYAYIGFLIVLPMIRILVQNVDRNIINYLLILFIVFETIIPLFQSVYSGISLNSYIGLSGFSSMVIIYPILGYYIEHYFKLKRKIYLLPMWIINIVLICCIEYGMMAAGSDSVDAGYSVAFNAFTIFATVKSLWNDDHESVSNKIISVIGPCTFGVYLFHPMLLERIRLLNKIWSAIEIKISWMNTMIIDVLFIIWILLLGTIITWIIRKIPIIKKFV